MRKLFQCVSIFTCSALLWPIVSCRSESKLKLGENRVTLEDAEFTENIGDDKIRYQVVPSHLLKETLNKAANSRSRSKQKYKIKTLYIGFPIDQLDKPITFGGVLTDVGNPEFGMLKLLNFPVINGKIVMTEVKSESQEEESKFYATIMSCTFDCTGKDDFGDPYVSIPVEGMTNDKEYLILNLAPLTESLNLVAAMDPKEKSFGHEKSKVKEVDYSQGTLVFDVLSTFSSNYWADIGKPAFDINVRFFIKHLKPEDKDDFEKRGPHKDIGYFLTEENSEDFITRMNIGTEENRKSIHYYAKGVPDNRKESFRTAFRNWNLSLSNFSDKDVLTYEFIDQGDAKYDLIQTGDIRYNVIEYDDKDLADYLGFGPSVANQWSGEILSGTVLIQGQTTIDFLTEWYELAKKPSQSQLLIKESKAKAFRAFYRGKELKIPSQQPEYQDNVSNVFKAFPEDVSLEDFINKVFETTVTHEIGHNLGFRHNFKGSLKTSDETQKISNSIMEYLPLEYDILNKLGDYDVEAFAYGYFGKEPSGEEPYCTDEDIPQEFSYFYFKKDRSPECARFDYTKDPFGYHLKRIKKGFDFVVGTGDPTDEGWGASRMMSVLKLNISHAGFYYSRADTTSETWVAWATNGRPDESVQAIKDHVVDEVHKVICSDRYQAQIDLKLDDDMQEEVAEKLESFRSSLIKKLTFNHDFPKESLACGE